jgi:hypothetical protein
MGDDDLISVDLSDLLSMDDTLTIDYDNNIIDTSNVSTITLDTTDTIYSDYTINTGMFETISVEQVKSMCEEYPALDKAWKNFKALYDMTLQDYKGKMKEQGLDDEIPF